MMPELPVAGEQLTRVTPLGVRFWDQVSRGVVSEGLVVTVYPLGNPRRRTRAMPNRSGVFVAQNLPGLRSVEYGKGDAGFWVGVTPPSSPFNIEVVDERGRFQPFQFTVDLPVKGLLPWAPDVADSPPSVLPVLPLYSTPARTVPAGMAVLRADLKDWIADRPAAWAVLEARFDGQSPVRGIAGKDGRIALVFPYPEPLSGPLGSPPGSPPSGERKPLLEQNWAVMLKAWYSASGMLSNRPDLSSVFMQQPVTLLATVSPETSLDSATLEFGKELTLKTAAHSELLIKSAV